MTDRPPVDPTAAQGVRDASAPAETLRRPAELTYAAELAALADADPGPKPPNWRLTPRAVATYLLGGETASGHAISAKYIGDRRLIETAIATLATDRALLLLGVPGTAKSWVSEHLAAGICGDSTRLIQGSAGADETQLRYGWNYAALLADGPSRAALTPTPMMRAMEDGAICRIEELTRIGADVQDTLITVLSEKTMPIPELNAAVGARRGFNVIATANNRDKGVNELSAALRRRFNVVVLPLPADAEEEIAIVAKRVAETASALALPPPGDAAAEIAKVVAIFRELRAGETADGRVALKSPSATLSTAEAIGAVIGGLSQAAYFSDGRLSAEGLAPNLVGAIVKDPVQDRAALAEYLETVLRGRPDFAAYYAALSEFV